MIRFLIADDEPQIRRGLRGLLGRITAGLDTEFLEAEDGLDALNQAREKAPDVLLLDIHMPRLKGLDLVSQLNALERDWIILIVTGHDEFEYARTALSLRVFDFLLKPVPESQFRTVIERALKELETRREARHFVDWSKDRLAQQRGVFRDSLLQDWVEGRLGLDDFLKSAQYLELAVPAQPCLVLVASPERGVEHNRYTQNARQAFLSYPGVLVFEDTRQNLVVLAGRDAGGWRSLAHRLAAAFGDPTPPIEGLDRETLAEIPQAWTRLVELIAGNRAEGGLVQGAVAFLEAQYRNPDLSLEAVADHLRISANYLSHLLKDASGKSFVTYLCHLRMDKAKVLLDDPRLRISEVAERVGYRDQNYFCRHFKTVTGSTPRDWRSGEPAPESKP